MKELEKELENLYKVQKELVDNSLRWTEGNGFYRLEASVLVPNGVKLKLKGTYNPKRNTFSFILLHKRKHKVRQFDLKSHWNPDNTHVSGPHKHYWSAEYNDTIAYEVDDVNPTDVDEAIINFLDECNISYEGIKYIPIGFVKLQT